MGVSVVDELVVDGAIDEIAKKFGVVLIVVLIHYKLDSRTDNIFFLLRNTADRLAFVAILALAERREPIVAPEFWGSVRTILWNFRFCRIFREKPGILIPQNHRLSPVNNSAESIKAQNGRAAKPRNPTRKRRKKHRINSQARRTCERTHPKASSRESGASNQARDTCPQAR